MFHLIKNDFQSVTGSNLRKIMLLVNKYNIEDLVPEDAMKIDYCVIEDENVWRIGFVNELTDVKFGESIVDGFTQEELDIILNHVCTT